MTCKMCELDLYRMAFLAYGWNAGGVDVRSNILLVIMVESIAGSLRKVNFFISRNSLHFKRIREKILEEKHSGFNLEYSR